MLVVIPVGDDNRKVLVDGVFFGGVGLDDEGSAEAVDVLAHVMAVNPVRA